MSPLRVALIHNRKPSRKRRGLPQDYYSECDSLKTIRAIAAALEQARYTVLPVEADRGLPRWLATHRVDLAFNIAEGFEGAAREARVPALLELMGIPYTGSGVLSLALALDKARAKQIFRFHGIPTPNFQIFSHPDEPVDPRLKVPLIVKPNREGSGKGINASSVVGDEAGLRRQIRWVHATYRQPVLVEEYIEGTELTVGILGEDQILPVLEIDFSGCRDSGESFYSWRMKEYQGNPELNLNPRFWCPARLDPVVAQAVQAVAFRAARALGTRDVARVDIRLSSDGIPYVLEVNPLPGMDPEESNLPIMARSAGIPYEALIQRLAVLARQRSVPSSFPLSREPVPPSALPEGEPSPARWNRRKGRSEAPAVACPSPRKRGLRSGACPRPGSGAARGNGKRHPVLRNCDLKG